MKTIITVAGTLHSWTTTNTDVVSRKWKKTGRLRKFRNDAQIDELRDIRLNNFGEIADDDPRGQAVLLRVLAHVDG